MKRQNGITLIALVITIIVLLILAGVSISMVTGDNGIASKAQLAKTETDRTSEEEEEKLEEALDYIDENAPNNSVSEEETPVVEQYTVKFLDYDETILQELTVNAGDSVEYAGTTTPSRPTGTYIYTFSGNWTLTNGGVNLADLSNVQSDLVLYPVFNTTSVCFVAGTEVLTENGLINIEDIRVGMKVYSYNEVTEKVELKEVKTTFVNYVDYSMTKVTVNGNVIESTSGHDYYVVGKGWIDACKIKEGDKLLNNNNEEVTVENVETIEFNGNILNTVYNFEVEDNHNYYVGDDCLMVHNADTVGHYC